MNDKLPKELTMKEAIRGILKSQMFYNIMVGLAICFSMLWVAQVKGYQDLCSVVCEKEGGVSTGAVFSCNCLIPDYAINVSNNNCPTLEQLLVRAETSEKS